MENTVVKVEFAIYGEEFNVEEMSEILKITPAKTWKKGDKIRKSERIHSDTCWMYSTGYEETLDVCTQLSKMMLLFNEKKELLQELKKRFLLDYIIEIVIEIRDTYTPGICFDTDFINFVSDIGAEIDIDTYVD